MKPIDVSRVKKTLGGFLVRIYHVDDVIHGAFYYREKWEICEWNLDGVKPWSPCVFRLVEEPETVEIDAWLNVYPDGECVVYSERTKADENAARNRFACIPIKRSVTKGEGLE